MKKRARERERASGSELRITSSGKREHVSIKKHISMVSSKEGREWALRLSQGEVELLFLDSFEAD